MPRWWHGVDHGQRDAIPGQPVRGERGRRRLGGQRALDQIEALIEAIAAIEHVVIFGFRRRQHGIAGFDDIASAHLERADAELFCQLVDRGLDGDQRLRQAVTAKRTCRHGVGIGGDAVDLLVRAIIDADAFEDRMKQHRPGMVAIGAGVGEYVELQRRELAVLVGACLDGDLHRMPRRGRDELFFPRQFEFDRSAGLERCERKNVFDEHFLLAAESAADALTEHPHLVGRQIEQVGERAPCQEWHLRAGADIEDSIGIDPGKAAMGFKRRMLDPLGRKSTFIGDGGLRQRARDIAKFAMGFRHDIAACVRDAVCRRLVAVNRRGAGRDGDCRIDHRRQDLVCDVELPAAFLRGGFGFGDHGGDLLPDKADDIVEHTGVVRIHPVPLVPRG